MIRIRNVKGFRGEPHVFEIVAAHGTLPARRRFLKEHCPALRNESIHLKSVRTLREMLNGKMIDVEPQLFMKGEQDV